MPEVLVVELADVGVDEPVGVPLAGRLERTASVLKEADRPVTFVQMEGGVTVPATKLTAAHLEKSAIHYLGIMYVF